MANTAALLQYNLDLNAQINFFTQQQVYWSGKYEANHAKLQKQIKYESQWESAFDSAIDNTKDLSCGGITVKTGNQNEDIADKYAHEKVKKYNEELSLELAEMDIEYDMMQSMYETQLTQLRAQEQASQSALQSAAQDTGLLQGG